jgi:hypothetical protein
MKKLIFTGILSVFVFFSFCQTNTRMNVIPPSPEAVSISQIDIADVNLYTGRFNYQLPLYNIEIGEFQYPIALNYVGGNGIKINEIASNVGLGWSFNGLGLISRTIRGRADDDNVGDFIGYIHLADFPAAALPESLVIYEKYADGRYDPFPDIYHLSSGPISASF